jgi:hypothetical protein
MDLADGNHLKGLKKSFNFNRILTVVEETEKISCLKNLLYLLSNNFHNNLKYEIYSLVFLALGLAHV